MVDDEFHKSLFEKLVRIDMGVEAAGDSDDVCDKFQNRVIEISEAIEEIKQMLNTLLAEPGRTDPFRRGRTDGQGGERLR